MPSSGRPKLSTSGMTEWSIHSCSRRRDCQASVLDSELGSQADRRQGGQATDLDQGPRSCGEGEERARVVRPPDDVRRPARAERLLLEHVCCRREPSGVPGGGRAKKGVGGGGSAAVPVVRPSWAARRGGSTTRRGRRALRTAQACQLSRCQVAGLRSGRCYAPFELERTRGWPCWGEQVKGDSWPEEVARADVRLKSCDRRTTPTAALAPSTGSTAIAGHRAERLEGDPQYARRMVVRLMSCSAARGTMRGRGRRQARRTREWPGSGRARASGEIVITDRTSRWDVAASLEGMVVQQLAEQGGSRDEQEPAGRTAGQSDGSRRHARRGRKRGRTRRPSGRSRRQT